MSAFSFYSCWLPTEHGTIFAFVGPMAAIIVVSWLAHIYIGELIVSNYLAVTIHR